MKSRENLMGNYRFRLSDMMPNAWFYKLKDMGKPRNHGKKIHHQISSPSSSISHPLKHKQPHHSYPRKSYYYTRDLVPRDGSYVSRTTNTKSAGSRVLDPPTKSSQKQSRKRNIRSSYSSSSASSTKLAASAGCRYRATLCTKTDSPPQYSASSSSDGSSPPPEFRSDCILRTRSFDNMVSLSHSSSCKAMNSEAKDIVVVDDDNRFVRKFDKLGEFDILSELQLPRIITKAVEFNHKKKQNNEPTNHRKSSTKFEDNNVQGSYMVKENKKTCPGRKFSVNSPGVRLRINSPKIGTRKFQGLARKSVWTSSSRKNLSESLAVVKSSFDPQKDFRESMVEMIRENNIRASKDLEDLLACYLSLNSDEHHGLIINVFKQIWFNLDDVRLQ